MTAVVRRVSAVVALLVATGCTGGQAASSTPTAPPTTDATAASAAAVEALRRIAWQMQEFTVDGQTTDVRSADASLGIDGDEMHAASCNTQRGYVEIREQTLRFSDVNTTEHGCGDFLAATLAEHALFAVVDEWLSWAIADDQLELSVANTTLRYAGTDTVNPISAGREVVHAAGNDAEYRVRISQGGAPLGLVLEARSVGPSWSFSHIDVGVQSEALHSVASAGRSPLFVDYYPDIHRHAYVASFVPIDTVRVVHQRRPDFELVELELFDFGDPQFLVAAGFTSRHSELSTITAYDGAGNVVASWP